MKTFLSQSGFTKNIMGIFFTLFFFTTSLVQAQTPYAMTGGNYSEDFANIANTTNWPANFNGTDSAEWASVVVNATGTVGDGVKISASTATFATGSGGGVQRGTANIQLLSTGTTNSCAIDLLLNFTGKNAGTLTFDAATVFNGAGNKNSILKVFYSTNGTTFTELTGTNLPYTATNNVAGNPTISVTLPSAFNNSATARLRFYEYSTTGFVGASASGNQPKISLDNIVVTGLSAGPFISGGATASAFTTTYGTASAVQTFPIIGASLTEDLLATAPTGFEVSSDGTTYGATATFTQSSGSASGSLRVRLKYNAPVLGSYNAQTIVLSSAGATSVNITTAASGNAVAAKSLSIIGLTADDKEYDGTTFATLTGTAALSGVLAEDLANVTLDGIYTADFSTPDVGVSIPVIVSGYSLLGSAASNYALQQPTGLSASITIAGLQAQTITFGALANATYGDAAITLGATASSGLTVSYSSSNTTVATVAGNTLTIVGVGTTTITASQLGDTSYNPAANVLQNITVNALPVTITGIAISDKPYNGTTAATITGTAVLSPSAVLGDDVAIGGTPVAVFDSAAVGAARQVTISGYALTGTKASNYALSQPTGLSAAITVADQTITFNALAAYYVNDASFTLAATASSALAVSYSSSNTAVATISGTTVTIVGTGTTTISATQAGDSNYNAALAVDQTLTVLATPIASWNFFGQSSPATVTATSFNANLVSAAGANTITRGSGAVASSGSNSFRTTGFQNNGIATTNTDYFQVTLTAAAGYQLSLSAITANFVGTASFFASPGVSSQFAYSLDGTNFMLIGSPIVNAAVPLSASIDLYGEPGLNNISPGTTITLRYYASGQTLTGGWGFASSAASPTNTNGLNILGTITALPPVVTTNAASAITSTTADLNGTVVANNNALTASFEYGTTTAYGLSATATTPVAGAVTGVASTPTSVSLSGLNPNTQYNFKAVGGSASGANATFYTLANVPGAPTVSNATSGSLDVSIAAADGNPAATTYAIQVLPGGLYVQANGSLGVSAVFQTATTWATTTITGLSSNTNYTIQVKAINGASVETAFGTGSAVSTLVSATPELQAQVLADFGSACLGTTSAAGSFALTGINLTTADVTVGPLSGFTFATTSTGTYTSSLTITPTAGSVSETIFVKFSPTVAQSYNGNIAIAGGGATAINVIATGTGINTPSTVTSGASSAITQTTVTIGGSSVAGCSAASAYGIEYSTTNGFSSGTQVASTNAALGSYTSDLSALNPNTTYYYKAYVVDNSGTVYGSQLSFTTLNLVAPVSTDATSISYNQFTANWNAVSSASSYNLSVYTLGTAENLVGWTFPISGATLTADVVNANNSGKAISVSNGTIVSSGGASLAATDYSASTTAWTVANKYWEISVNTTGYKNIKLSSQQIASNTGPRDFKIQYKIGVGGTYADVTGGTVLVANNWTSGVVNNLALPAVCDNQALVYLRWIPTSTTSANGGTVALGGTSRIDNIYIKGSLRSDLAGYNPLAVNATSQSVTGLTGSTTYYYEVAATAGLAVSPVSNTISTTTMVPPPTASAQTFCNGATVANLVATGTDLKWYDVASGGTALVSTTALATGTYYVSQTINGSESERTSVEVTVTPSTTTGSVTTSACDSYTWAANGVTYTSSQTNLTHIVGCNTATLNLTITPSTTTGSVTTSACDSYTWAANGVTYTSSQTNLTHIVGCNTATLNLTITPNTSNITFETACTSYTWADNSQTYTTSGTYTGTTTNCVTEQLVLTITTPPAQPSLACYETAVLNTTTCTWDITGTQPPMPTSQPIPNTNYSNLSAFTAAAVNKGHTISATETFDNLNGFYSGLSGNFGAGTPTWTASATGGLFCGAAGGSMTLSTNNPTPLTLTFNPGVTGLGANIFVTDSSFNIIPGTITVTFSNGSTNSFSATSASDFFGATANSALITSVSISSTNTITTNGYVTVDNLVIATGTLIPTSNVNYSDLSNFSAAAVTAGHTISATETFDNLNGFYSGLSGNFGAGSPTWTASATGGLFCGTAGGSMTLSTNNPTPLTLTFNPGVTALGANIFITDSSFNVIPGTITVTFANGDTNSFSTTMANDFFGAIAYSVLITSISISSTNTANTNGYVTVDNLVIATGIINPTLACYQSYVFNSNTCAWDVTGLQPLEPTTALACYETRAFNTGSCSWVTSGTQPAQPTLACYETATFNTTSCVWDVTATSGSTTYYADVDGDGFGDASTSIQGYTCLGTPTGYVTDATDCNDAIAAINPGHVEVLYNGIDDNCDGQLDEGNQATSALQTTSCGQTLTAMGSLIYAEINLNATAYRFKVVNNATGDIQYVDNTHQWFALNWLASYDYATAYTVSVQLQIAGVWVGYYGTSCVVNSPAITDPAGSLQLVSTQCGATLPSIATVIYTTPQSGATGYRFRITDVTPDATGDNLVQVKDRSYHWFTMQMLTRYNYGSTYMVEVAVKTTGGYTGYGSPCYINTPASPMLNNCGAVIPTSRTLVYTAITKSVTQYRFQVTRVSDQSARTFDTSKFWFSFKVNMPGYTPSVAYAVRVAVMTAGTWSPFGDACEITSPAIPRTDGDAELDFAANVFPNPYTDQFNLLVNTDSDERISYRVYDMLGKLIEADEFDYTALETKEFGRNYPAGVYNIIVSQGEERKTLRIIKR